VLLNIFELYRLPDPESDEYRNEIGMVFVWICRCWWYKLAHVCRQWRNIILESPSRLDLHLFCTNGVPVADMLAHSPPLPLTIYYADRKITAEDESGILLALSHRDRLHHIYLRHTCFRQLPNMEKFVTVMDEQFPNLERMYIRSRIKVVLPLAFQAPNLRHIRLSTVSVPIGSPLLTTTAAGLVTLELLNIPESAFFPPSYILSQLSLMLQLEKLSIAFKSPINPDDEMESRQTQTPDTTTLPNLHWFAFVGVSAYLDGLVARISAPSLSTFRVYLFPHLPFTFPHLLQFMQSSENFTFTALQVTFGTYAISLHAVPWKRHTPLMLQIRRRHLNWQVASAVQLFATLSPVFSVVEQVAFSYQDPFNLQEWRAGNRVTRSQWHGLLRPFVNAKTILVQGDLNRTFFRFLPSDDGEPPLDLLPSLEEVGYSGGGYYPDGITRFLNERKIAGHPVRLFLVNRWMFDDEPAALSV
jgi:hypothetical protein